MSQADSNAVNRRLKSPIKDQKIDSTPSKRSKNGKTKRKPSKSEVKKEVLVDVVLSDCEGEFGPRTSSPDRGMYMYMLQSGLTLPLD